MMVADIEELETMDASEIFAKKRLDAKEVIFPTENGKFIFQSQRRSGTENTHIDTGIHNSRRTSQRLSW